MPTLWNSLPIDTQQTPSLHPFGHLLKTSLFRQAYPDAEKVDTSFNLFENILSLHVLNYPCNSNFVDIVLPVCKPF